MTSGHPGNYTTLTDVTQQAGGSFWVEPLFNGATLLIAIGIAGYAQRRKGTKSK